MQVRSRAALPAEQPVIHTPDYYPFDLFYTVGDDVSTDEDDWLRISLRIFVMFQNFKNEPGLKLINMVWCEEWPLWYYFTYYFNQVKKIQLRWKEKYPFLF